MIFKLPSHQTASTSVYIQILEVPPNESNWEPPELRKVHLD